MKKYQPKEIEGKWQQKWQETSLYKTDLSKPDKYYVLAEFTYPSGDLHVGHWFTFCGADIFARAKRMQGYNVFFPNGFDSFGLPAEGAAIKRGIHPAEWTNSNIVQMKKQFATLGASFDFYGDLQTHQPTYYRWNQWIFLKMFEQGLAYRGKYLSNWCPSCQTVLANEAVESGKCWRCGTEVEQKEIAQWFLKITDYADQLIWDQDPAVDWPQATRDAQNNWIGKSEGVEVKFQVSSNKSKQIEVFTTRPDTLLGASFIVINPEHTLLNDLIVPETKETVGRYTALAKKKSELERKENKEKSGVFTGSYVTHPLTEETIPVWVADYVLPGYGTGAVMGVPAHDERDFEFAQKYDLPIIRVVSSEGDLPYTGEGILVNSGNYNGLSSSEAREKIAQELEEKGIGKLKTQYHLHDWSISRQRYWGTPIPIVHCPGCGTVPLPEDQLPLELPLDVDYTPRGKSPLETNEEWINVKCPKCGGDAKRDPDTMDTFVDSSWYFFRFVDPLYTSLPFDTELAKKILPVNAYFGGAEHTLGHTLYSRFFTRFFKSLGLTDLEEYALKRVNHGIVLGPDGQKMSKSKGNVVNPDLEVQKYGTDAVRIHVAFFMPYDGVGPWISERIWGPYHFLERVWGLSEKVDKAATPNKADLAILHKTVQKVATEVQNIKFNTAIAALMEYLNYLSKKDKVTLEEYKTLILLLAPFAPHITEEIWQEILGEKESVHLQIWPKVDQDLMVEDQVKITVQINGKLRDVMTVENNLTTDQSKIEELVKNNPKVNKYLEGKQISKIIYIPGKIINIVIPS